MDMNAKLRCGIAGVVGRGQVYVNPILLSNYAQITAICDLNEEGMLEWKKKIGGDVKLFTSYEEMIDSGLVDLVFVATPMPLHVPQSIYALDRNVNVVSEVAAATTVEEAKMLYKAVKSSKARYMMAENVNFYKSVIIIDGLVKAGYLGEVHYAEGQYLHYGGSFPVGWRAQTIKGANYCTHNLGPMLKWFDNERISQICCIGSGRHRTSDDGKKRLARDMSNILMCKTESNRLMQVRLDFDTPTPYMLPFEVNGTKGKALIRKESPTEENYIFLQSADYDQTSYMEQWRTLEYYEREFLPPSWIEATHKLANTGHSRADYVMVIEILNAFYNGDKLPIDIDMTINMTLPGILSIESAEKGGIWIDVPRMVD